MATVNMYVGQVATYTPTATGSDSATAPSYGYVLSVVAQHPAFIQPTIDVGGALGRITALSAGTSTVTWTATPKAPGYSGSAVTETDTVVVAAARTLSTLTGTYGTAA